METIILDDGWHSDHDGPGYGHTGDWEVCTAKIPDMAAHVRRVHDLGMKYMVWYSVPFIGYHAKNFARFENKLLRKVERNECGVLDPRYPDVREYLIGIYEHAVREYDLDGLKLDFIDQFEDRDRLPLHPDMDYACVQEATERLMMDVMKRVRAIKPGIMIEFRQRYIGPAMHRFGNMFRVGDCAGNYLKNRASILDLRMLMGNQAVHSDMLTLTPYEKPENNALQIISCMFGVLQYSCRMEEMTPELEEMSIFWLNFLKKHRTLLLQGKLEAFEPHLLYTWAKSTLDNACAVGIYSIDRCVQPDAVDRIYIANGSAGNRILLELSGVYHIQILDCRGRERSCEERTLSGITALPVPSGGLAILTRE
jgi:alpha-galactosidase